MKTNNKKWWAILIVVVIFLIIGSALNSQDYDNIALASPDVTDIEMSDASDDVSDDVIDDVIDDSSTSIVEPPLTFGQQNALSKAYDYLDYSAFSHDGLIEQLSFEGFSTEEATYAADNCGADWNEQAALKAQEYLDYSSFSRDGLIEQLEFEGFTSSQASYGVDAVGY